MLDIFLSYAEEDRDSAQRIATLLEQSGWTVWWDRRIRAGTRWRSAIADALGKMRCMVVLWSRNSVASEWVNEEAEQARLAGKLVPVLIDHVRPPIGFQEYQCADLADWNGSPRALAFRHLILDIKALLGTPTASAGGRIQARTPQPARTEAAGNTVRLDDNSTDEVGRHRKTKAGGRKLALSLLAAVVVVVIAAAVIATMRSWQTPAEWTGSTGETVRRLRLRVHPLPSLRLGLKRYPSSRKPRATVARRHHRSPRKRLRSRRRKSLRNAISLTSARLPAQKCGVATSCIDYSSVRCCRRRI